MDGGPTAAPDQQTEQGPGDVLGLIIARRNGGMIKLFAAAGLATIAIISVVTLLPMSIVGAASEPGFWILLALGAAVAAVTFTLPWAGWEARQARIALTGLMVAGIVLVGGLVSQTGGTGSDQLWSLLLITVFAAVVHTPRAQSGLFACSVAAYLAGSALAGPIAWGTAVFRIAIIGGVAVTTGYLAGMMRRSMRELDAAKVAAEQHATHLALVARGVRSAASTDPTEVVVAVAETVRGLGWHHVAIFVTEPDGSLDLAAWSSADGRSPEGQVVALSAEWATEILRQGTTVTASDTATHPTLGERARALHVTSAVGAPFLADGQPGGVVIAGSPDPHRFTHSDVETFELIASCAGRALELARRYGDEHERVTELRELDRLRSEFLSTVSHELRTPLTVILGLSETIDRIWDHIDDHRRRELLDRIRDNAGGLDRVIATLLDFSRLEQGRLETRFDTFDLGHLVATVVVRLGPMLVDHTLVLDVAQPLLAHGDERLLERVLENLLSNARRHTPPGTTVTVSCRASGRSIDVRVEDDGPGIAASDLAHLGERFYRAGDPASRPSRGVGLGLALTQEVLRLHGTSLRITSTLGRGTTFAFSLPAPVVLSEAQPPRGTSAPAG